MNRARIRTVAALGPIMLVLLVAIGCVPNPPRYGSGGATHRVTAPKFTRTLGMGRANNPAVVRFLQDKLNVLSAKWGRNARPLAGHNGSGTYDQRTIDAIVWARRALNAHTAHDPFGPTDSPILGEYGYDLIVGATAGSKPVVRQPTAATPRSVATPRPVVRQPTAATPRPAATPPAGYKPAAPSTGALLGTWIAPRGTDWTQATQQGLWNQREAAAGRKYDIAHNFYPWTSAFPTWREPWNISQGRIPMVSWNGTNTGAILSGQYDGMIRDRAVAMRDLHAPTFLRFYWEMDGAKKAEWANGPADYIAAWRHVHQIFDAAGADNVAWVWCPNAWAFDVNAQNAAQWYPGDDSVDWICSDGYNWSPVKSGARWTSFQTVFNNFYNWASTKNKPLMIGEFGVMEQGPNQKAQWIDEARTTLKTKFPKIKAIVYYDEDRHEDNTVYDWRLDSTSSSYAAWNNLAKDPYFNRR